MIKHKMFVLFLVTYTGMASLAFAQKTDSSFVNHVLENNGLIGGNYICLPFIKNNKSYVLAIYNQTLKAYYNDKGIEEKSYNTFIKEKLLNRDTITVKDDDSINYKFNILDCGYFDNHFKELSIEDILAKHSTVSRHSSDIYFYNGGNGDYILAVIYILFLNNIITYEDDETGTLVIDLSHSKYGS